MPLRYPSSGELARRGVWASLVVAAIWVCAALLVDHSNKEKFLSNVLLFVLVIGYGYGSVLITNLLLDRSKPTVISTRVKEKQTRKGRRLLTVEPWRKGWKEDVVEVQSSTHDSLSIGDTACVYIREGGLGIQWYAVDLCPQDKLGESN